MITYAQLQQLAITNLTELVEAKKTFEKAHNCRVLSLLRDGDLSLEDCSLVEKDGELDDDLRREWEEQYGGILELYTFLPVEQVPRFEKLLEVNYSDA